MLRHRIIPCLLLSEGALVKTCKFRDPSYIGDPVTAVRIFNEKEVDELIVLDIAASKQGRAPDFSLIEEIAGECFMPLCYGGGISKIEQAKQLFALGVEKICIQKAALSDFGLVRAIAERYGRQSIVVSIDVKRGVLGGYRLYASARRKELSIGWQSFIRGAIAAGAGEVMLTSVDREGTLAGMDLRLIAEAAVECQVPLIAAGGAANLSDIHAALARGASAVAAGAMFVYQGPHRAVLIS